MLHQNACTKMYSPHKIIFATSIIQKFLPRTHADEDCLYYSLGVTVNANAVTNAVTNAAGSSEFTKTMTNWFFFVVVVGFFPLRQRGITSSLRVQIGKQHVSGLKLNALRPRE